jgi:hypothetical protein
MLSGMHICYLLVESVSISKQWNWKNDPLTTIQRKIQKNITVLHNSCLSQRPCLDYIIKIMECLKLKKRKMNYF